MYYKHNVVYHADNIQAELDTRQSILSISNRLDAALIATAVLDSTEFHYLDGVTSAIQTQLNAKQSTLSTANRIDDTFIGTGVVTTTEFNYLDGVTSAIQTQIGTKQSTCTSPFRLDAAFIATGSVNSPKYNYLSGLTSDIQTQIYTKQASLSAANRLDAAFIGSGVVTTTEFNYLDGVTNPIQAQLNSIAASTQHCCGVLLSDGSFVTGSLGGISGVGSTKSALGGYTIILSIPHQKGLDYVVTCQARSSSPVFRVYDVKIASSSQFVASWLATDSLTASCDTSCSFVVQ